MKVALNATSLSLPLTAIGQYTYLLAKSLQALPEQELNLYYGSGWSKEDRVNLVIVRANEILRLCGSNSYLKKLIGFSSKFTFDQTLRSIFKAKT